jgi:hypothetical protein
MTRHVWRHNFASGDDALAALSAEVEAECEAWSPIAAGSLPSAARA